MPMSRSEVRAAVVASLAEIAGASRDRIADGDRLVEQLGLDSFTSAGCLVAVEERLGTRVPEGCEGALADVKTVGELVDRLMATLSAEPPG